MTTPLVHRNRLKSQTAHRGGGAGTGAGAGAGAGAAPSLRSSSARAQSGKAPRPPLPWSCLRCCCCCCSGEGGGGGCCCCCGSFCRCPSARFVCLLGFFFFLFFFFLFFFFTRRLPLRGGSDNAAGSTGFDLTNRPHGVRCDDGGRKFNTTHTASDGTYINLMSGYWRSHNQLVPFSVATAAAASAALRQQSNLAHCSSTAWVTYIASPSRRANSTHTPGVEESVADTSSRQQVKTHTNK